MVKNLAHFNNCHCITGTIFICKEFLNVKYCLMEAKGNEISNASFKKTEISRQLNVSRTTVHWVERLKAFESLKERPRSGRRHSKEATKKAFENDS